MPIFVFLHVLTMFIAVAMAPDMVLKPIPGPLR